MMTTMLNQNNIPSAYYLNTPLNESLVYINTLLPMFKKKYDIERMTFITLTDASNHVNTDIIKRKKIGRKLLSLLLTIKSLLLDTILQLTF